MYHRFHAGKRFGRRRLNTAGIKLLCIIMIVMSSSFLVVGKWWNIQNMAQVLKQKAMDSCFYQMLELTVPIVTYEKGEGVLPEDILPMVWRVILPTGVLAENQLQLKEGIESEISYESILQKEANDENSGLSGASEGDGNTENAIEGSSEQELDNKNKSETNGNQTENKDTIKDQAQIKNSGLEESNKTGDQNKTADDSTVNTATDETANTGFNDNANTASGETASVFQPTVSPVNNIALEKLNDFDYLIHQFYVVDSSTTITGSQLNAGTLMAESMKITSAPDTPQILIYHTHSQERYADSDPNDKNQSVLGVGEHLAQILRDQYGFNVLHHMGEYDVGSRDNAYSRAGPVVEQLLRDNPGIQVVIDLHRDGVAEGTHLVTTVNGVSMASIMFFNGLSRTTSLGDIGYLKNPYIQDNLAFSLQMQVMAESYYPGFSRRIYLKGYRYNMHYCPKSLLVEVGAQTNTVEEAMNAMDPLADILAKVVGN